VTGRRLQTAFILVFAKTVPSWKRVQIYNRRPGQTQTFTVKPLFVRVFRVAVVIYCKLMLTFHTILNINTTFMYEILRTRRQAGAGGVNFGRYRGLHGNAGFAG
jgi:hypothetical protein